MNTQPPATNQVYGAMIEYRRAEYRKRARLFAIVMLSLSLLSVLFWCVCLMKHSDMGLFAGLASVVFPVFTVAYHCTSIIVDAVLLGGRD